MPVHVLKHVTDHRFSAVALKLRCPADVFNHNNGQLFATINELTDPLCGSSWPS
jgi:hypothetical protein